MSNDIETILDMIYSQETLNWNGIINMDDQKLGCNITSEFIKPVVENNNISNSDIVPIRVFTITLSILKNVKIDFTHKMGLMLSERELHKKILLYGGKYLIAAVTKIQIIVDELLNEKLR